MDCIIPGASQNTGVFKTTKYGDGDYEMEIKEASWDDSRYEEKKEASLVVKCVITDGPDKEDGKSPIGKEKTIFLKQRYEASEDWMIENDTTKIVALFNAVDLKIPKSNKLPIKDLPGKSFIVTLENRSYTAKDGTEKDVFDVPQKSFNPFKKVAE